MSARTVRSAMLARLPRRDDDRGSIPFLLLVMIITVALGAVLMKTIIDQTRTSRFDQTRVRSLNAAQAGVDYTLGLIRTAVTSGDTTKGDAAALPCGPWSNMPADTQGKMRFNATVDYYTSNPIVMSNDDRTKNKMVCATRNGPYDKTAQKRTPKFAVITSTGRDTGVTGSGASRGRTVETTFVFQTNDVNISGGQIRIFPAPGSTTSMCMDAGDNPVAGRAITLAQCSNPSAPTAQQVFAYRPDLSIELVSSSKPPAVGLCLDTSDSTHTLGRPIVLKNCTVADETPTQPTAPFVCPSGQDPASFKKDNPTRTCAQSAWNQQWSIDDSAHLQGANNTGAGKTGTDIDNTCIEAASQTSGQALLLQTCAGSVTDTKQTWVPSPTTGAGQAGAGVNQLVNFAQFATCIDVTGKDVNTSFLITYTCKQNPDPSKVAWNQKFTPSPSLAKGPTTAMLTTSTNGSNKYCLKSPLRTGTTDSPAYVTLTSSCSNTSDVTWTVSQLYVSSSDDALALPYSDRYTIKDSNGMCLALGANDDLLNGQYNKIIVTQCNGSTYQKWNADPSKLGASLMNTRERESAIGG